MILSRNSLFMPSVDNHNRYPLQNKVFSGMAYSYRKDSIGSSRAAFNAG